MRRWVIAFTGVFLTLLALDVVPELRGGWGWRWPYRQPEDYGPVAVLAGVLALYGAGVWVLRRYDAWVVLHLLWGITGAFVIALGVQNIRNDAFFMLFSHTVSPVQTGASTVAVRFLAEEGVHESLNRWPDVMRESQDLTITHFTTSPPGKALVHHWTADALDPIDPIAQPLSMSLRDYQCSTLNVMEYDRGQMVSAGFGMLMPLWAGLAILPLFIIAGQLGATTQQAARLTAWWAVVPSLLLFAPTWNTLYPLLAVTALSGLIAGLRRQQMAWVVLAGLVTSIMTFLNFAVLPLLGLYGFFTLIYWYAFVRPEGSFWWAVQVGLYFGVGLSVTWLLFGFYTGLTPWDLLAVTFDTHLDIERNYSVWLVLHVYDMLMFAGWPLVALGAWGLWQAVQRLRAGASGLQLVDVLVFSLILTILVLDLSGITRAESARIWLFFVPFILLSGVDILQQQGKFWDMPLFGAQLLSVGVMATVLPVVAFDMNPPVDGPRTDVATLDFRELIAVDAHFEARDYAGEFALAGYRYVADPSNQIITLELQWEGIAPTERPYQLELIARAENEIDGEIVSEPFYWYPQNGNYLTTCWQQGDVISEVLVVPVPPVSMPVQWTLQVRAIHSDDTPLVRGMDAEDDTALLGPVPYP